ncbi:unnamed protein product [Nesidiocoris tenuis]|uniref:Uncharacterized protein n=1 Tax=Nesidiocoris tenuis TaxID=355587 RepID=A0A6H5HJF8_9HEMI|nr:unnamed protein product [Nesidiocoris tenuis]
MFPKKGIKAVFPLVRRSVKWVVWRDAKFSISSTSSSYQFDKVHKLECRYHEEYSKLHAKRDYIVRGAVEPTDDELYPGEPVRLIQGELAEKLAKDKFEGPGVPDFWPTIFKNVAVLNEIVYPCDEPILKHLIDVRCSLTENPMGFQLAFHFTPNEYFKNPILTKDYFMKCEPDKEDPFSFEGPEIFKAAEFAFGRFRIGPLHAGKNSPACRPLLHRRTSRRRIRGRHDDRIVRRRRVCQPIGRVGHVRDEIPRDGRWRAREIST